MRIEIPIRAVPKGRARSGSGQHYTPARTRVFEQDCQAHLFFQYRDPPLEGRLSVTLIFYGNPRGDLDNLAKSVLDAAQANKRLGWKGVFKNDSQIDDLWIRREPDKLNMILMLVEPRG